MLLISAEIWVQCRLTSSEIRADEVEWSRFFSEFFGFPLLNIIHTHLSAPPAVYDSLEQAAHYQTLGPTLGMSPLTRQLAGLRLEAVMCTGLLDLNTFRYNFVKCLSKITTSCSVIFLPPK
jgi:hypothetical protein